MKITQYEQKGIKTIPIIRISPKLFNKIYARFKAVINFCDDIEVWNNIRHGLWKKYKVYYFYNNTICESQRTRLIVNGHMIRGTLLFMWDEAEDSEYKEYLKRLIDKLYSSKDYEIISDPSNSGYEMLTLSPLTVKSQFSKLAKKVITREQLQELVDKVGSETRVKPFAYRYRKIGKVMKWNNCIYQDMHKAHSSFLLRTFKDYPEIINWVNKNNEMSAKFKYKGDLEKAHYYKDFPNILVGCLGQSYKSGVNKGQPVKWLLDVNTRPLYNTCVNETFRQIDDYCHEIMNEDSNLIYAQTDGLIMQRPSWDKVKVSDKVGEFGREDIDDNVVYTYYSRTTSEETGYMIYQYFKHGEKVVVGDLPNELKDKIDLSKGQVVKFKLERDEFRHNTYTDIKVINIEVEENK